MDWYKEKLLQQTGDLQIAVMFLMRGSRSDAETPQFNRVVNTLEEIRSELEKDLWEVEQSQIERADGQA